jgi:ureidoacrylate peracid hydrolase
LKTDNEEIVTAIRNRAELLLREWNRPEHLYKLDKDRAVFIVIDMQNFVCSPGDGQPLSGLNEVIRNINTLADHFHDSGIPVIWIRQNFTGDEKENDAGLYPLFHRKPLSGEVCNRSRGTEISADLHYDNALDIQVPKNRYSAFIRGASNLEEILKSLNRNQLIIAGLAANVCVESTARDAMQLDYEVILVKNATSTFDEILLEATLTNVKIFFGDVRSTEEVLEELRR